MHRKNFEGRRAKRRVEAEARNLAYRAKVGPAFRSPNQERRDKNEPAHQ